MFTDIIGTLFQGMIAVALGIARIMPCLLLCPIFSFSTLRGMVRNGIVVSLALFVEPVIQPSISGLLLTPWAIVGLALKEIILGLLLGYLLALPFWLFNSVGSLFDSQRGALNAGELNPALGPDATPLGDILLRWSMVFLVMTFGLSLVTQVIWDSYRLWPVNQLLPGFTEEGFKQLLDQVSGFFTDTVLYAGPLVLMLLLIEFAVGIISIYSPQLQANVLSVPLKCLVGMLFFIVYLPILEHMAGVRFSALRDLIPHLHDLLTKEPS
ncbi:EscT/YscT/HrcT family type III secretion system export apparatus protein [Pantoea sp. Al-1710]|uniref:EscT/YscT/HrcT family type III secretion system export apparatus protein n=1 Tax=Candidatus Pantoea communis TaxID=2608354 RepID=A0ABX0RI89_9GAMM|nr:MULTISPECIES: type III secretion system export apparatus subunit SctT [Pantoea]NIG12939.1 EscT/YscT/HrcT family type III secretion system export apparatus protein [Pantoea sp. Cy-640]NIG17360.1 EscT/YscT/HrcT family type III secretion system export apparatus protein [Pantoea communis]